MITLLQAEEVVEKTTGVIKAVSDGNFDTLLNKLISLGVDAGKSIL